VRPPDRSWLSLLGFFAVITLGSSLIFAVVFAGVTAAIAGGESAQAAEDQQPVDPLVPGQIFSGMITDAHCGSRHTDSKNSASECARMCVRNGSKYVMINGDKNYELNGAPEQFGRLAGQRVNLTGVLSGGAIQVSSARLQSTKMGE
jgi:hypothetical protein